MTQHAAVAEAFCSHRFSEAYPHLADGVRWVMVGGATLTGKPDVIAACERTLEELASVTTRFRRLRVIDSFGSAVIESVGSAVVESAGSVVVDSIAEYHEPGGVLSVVASCDILDFTDGWISEITSYTVELTEPAAAE